MADVNSYPKKVSDQKQDVQPGRESIMNPLPIFEDAEYKGTGKLKGKVAVITGGDSGIGKAVALAYAKEGAKIAIIYLNEDDDANYTKSIIEKVGSSCILIKGDVGCEQFCKDAIDEIIGQYAAIDILVNNSAEQHNQNSIEDITSEQLQRTFKTNIFSMFYMTKYAMPHLKDGSAIINTSSVTAYKGSKSLIDYSSTKGAIVSFTRSLALSLAGRNIRVNSVAPGPIWTPLIPSTALNASDVGKFGANTPLKRPGQPIELAGAYVFLASCEASYITGQTIHVNGGEIVNG
ncbi:MAG: SDR family oxidoreductase [Clostridium sp.]|nr:SDR family oxidoreductase [Clostridium sp.]